MLNEETVHACPLGLSPDSQKLESIERAFTNHHIDGDASNSVYWNLIRICEPCHAAENRRHQDGTLQRKIRLRKRNLAIQYLGPLAVNVLRLAYIYETTSAMPAMVVKLLEKGYLTVAGDNVFSVGACKHVTLQDYRLTPAGRTLVEKLIGTSEIAPSTFAL